MKQEKKVLPVIMFLASETSSITSGKILLILQSQVQMPPPLCEAFSNSQSQIQGYITKQQPDT